jgi:hypothetical protein
MAKVKWAKNHINFYKWLNTDKYFQSRKYNFELLTVVLKNCFTPKFQPGNFCTNWTTSNKKVSIKESETVILEMTWLNEIFAIEILNSIIFT